MNETINIKQPLCYVKTLGLYLADLLEKLSGWSATLRHCTWLICLNYGSINQGCAETQRSETKNSIPRRDVFVVDTRQRPRPCLMGWCR